MSLLLFFRKPSQLQKAYISGHYRKLKSGQQIFIPAHHDKRKPKDDKPLAMDYEAWRDHEVSKHIKHLRDQGKSTVSVKEFLEQHYTHAHYDHHIKQLENAKLGRSVENPKRRSPEKLLHRKKVLVVHKNQGKQPETNWAELGEIKADKKTGKFLAIEKGTSKKIGADGGLVSDYNPTLYDTEQDAINAINARIQRNKDYADPVKRAERKAAQEKIAKDRSEKADNVTRSLTNLPAGFSANSVSGKIMISGKFDKELHSRLKRAGAILHGAGYDKKERSGVGDIDFNNATWSIDVDDADKLNDVLGRAKSAIAKEVQEKVKKAESLQKFKQEKNVPIKGVTFAMKDDFKKEFGARWDSDRKTWHVSEDQAEAARKWVEDKAPKPQPKQPIKHSAPVFSNPQKMSSDYADWEAQEDYGETRGESFQEYLARKYGHTIQSTNYEPLEDY